MKRSAIAFIVAAAFTGIAQAAITVSTGSPTGTYGQMFNQIVQLCGSKVSLSEWKNSDGKPSSGSVETVDNVLLNKSQAGFAQTDVLKWKEQTDDRVASVKTLLVLHPEEVHLLALAKTRKEGGIAGFGGKEVSLNTIDDLAGKKVGAWGGSYITAQLVRLQSEVAYNVVEFPDQASALVALEKGAVDAVLAVGGQPMGWVEKLPNTIKLLSIPDARSSKMVTYNKARLNYRNLGAAGVQTVSVDALLVTRTFKTADKVAELSALRQCVEERIDEFREKNGFHPKWQVVNPENRGKWPYYELPQEPTAPAPTKPTTKKR